MKKVRCDKGRAQVRVPSDFDPESTPGENWRSVVGWEKFYWVSDIGRIRSLHQQGRFTIGMCVSGGYRVMKLRDNGRAANGMVHVLVLEAFVGPRPTGFHACHNNGNSSDNRLINLRWDTVSANQADKKTHGTDWYSHGRVLNEKLVHEIRSKPDLPDDHWMDLLGVCRESLVAARIGRTWKHVKAPPVNKMNLRLERIRNRRRVEPLR
jgi:hypothetical protein